MLKKQCCFKKLLSYKETDYRRIIIVMNVPSAPHGFIRYPFSSQNLVIYCFHFLFYLRWWFKLHFQFKVPKQLKFSTCIFHFLLTTVTFSFLLFVVTFLMDTDKLVNRDEEKRRKKEKLCKNTKGISGGGKTKKSWKLQAFIMYANKEQ